MLFRSQVFATSYYYAELNCARMLQELNISMMPGQEESSGDSREEGGRFADNADFGSGGDFGLGAEAMGKLGALAESLHMELDRLQFRAVAESIRNGLFLLSGGPGTGRTMWATLCPSRPLWIRSPPSSAIP